jgi:putative transposase
MPRIPRHLTHRPEGTYHIVMRGNDRIMIFFDDDDRVRFMESVAQEVVRETIVVHHYVLMGNHVHLIVRLGPHSHLSAPMQRIAQAYAKHHAQRYGRTGHLWEGRFKSFPITTDAYLLACGIYVGLNPVRAGIVESPERYRWSSHAAYVTQAADLLVEHDAVYLGLAQTPALRRDVYQSLTRMWLERGLSPDKARRFFSEVPDTVLPT